MKQTYRRADRRLREWRRTRPLVWGVLYGGVPALCFAVALTVLGRSLVRAALPALVFGLVFAGLSAWTTRDV